MKLPLWNFYLVQVELWDLWGSFGEGPDKGGSHPWSPWGLSGIGRDTGAPGAPVTRPLVGIT